MLTIVVKDKIAEVIRIRQLIAPVPGSWVTGIDDIFHVVCVIPARFAGLIRTGGGTQLWIIIVRDLREDRSWINCDVATREDATNDLPARIAEHILLKFRCECPSFPIGAVVSQMK